MVKASIKVCIRTRPTQDFAQDKIIIDTDHNVIQIQTSSDNDSGGLLNNKQNSFKFRFDQVFHNASQSAIYDLRARSTVLGVIEGINSAIMTYGQTGSGKTFTMLGDTSNYEHRGLAPRALNQIFNEISSRVEYEYRVFITYMEIYNERIFDLLDDLSHPNQSPDLAIVDEKDGRGTYVRGLNEIEVLNEKEALNLLFGGELARTTATHRLNKRSNRSHSIFTIYVQKRQRSGGSSLEKIIHSKLHLVDLAGSERIKKTMDSIDGTTMGDEVTRKESMAINQSLSYLEQCVVALSRKGQVHIPYRQSKLTSILKDCIGANCNTLMFACMWGESAHLEETISTLRFASRMMKVENDASQIETIDTVALVKKQAKQIKILKQELSMHDALAERSGVLYEPFSEEKQEYIKQLIEEYMQGTDDDEENNADCTLLNISSVRQMIEICKQFKILLLQTRNELEIARNDALVRAMSSHGMSANYNDLNGFNNNTNNDNNNNGDGYISHTTNNLIDNNNNTNVNTNTNQPHFNITKVITVGSPEETYGSKGGGFVLGNAPTDSRPFKSKQQLSQPFDNSMNNGYNHTNGNNGNNMIKDRQIMFPDLNNSINPTAVYGSSSSKGGGGGGQISGPTSPTTNNKSLFNQSFNPTTTTANNNTSASPSSSSNQLFDLFSKSDGNELYQSYMENKQYTKELKQKLKEIALKLNESKLKIDQINIDLNEKKVSLRSSTAPTSSSSSSSVIAISHGLDRNNKNGIKNNNISLNATTGHNNNINNNTNGNDAMGIVDDEEFRLLNELKEVKLFYKNGHTQYEELKKSLIYSQQLVDQIKTDLVDQFMEWSNGMSDSGTATAAALGNFRMASKVGTQNGNNNTTNMNGMMSTNQFISSPMNNNYQQQQQQNNIMKSAFFDQDDGVNAINNSYHASRGGNGGGGDFNMMNNNSLNSNDNNLLDDQEAFERMEEAKIMATDPESLPFFNAQKTRKALLVQNNSAIKHMRKTKRNI